MPGNPGEPVVTTLVCYSKKIRTRGCGCTWRPAFPTPSLGGRFWHSSGVSSRENAESRVKWASRHCEPTGRAREPDDRLSEAIHCAAKKKNGLLRRFAPRNDDDGAP